jgi:hypothetical protein
MTTYDGKTVVLYDGSNEIRPVDGHSNGGNHNPIGADEVMQLVPGKTTETPSNICGREFEKIAALTLWDNDLANPQKPTPAKEPAPVR